MDKVNAMSDAMTTGMASMMQVTVTDVTDIVACPGPPRARLAPHTPFSEH